MANARRRILVVEDDTETAAQVVDSLSTSGYRVDLAVDGDDGLSRGRCADYAVMAIDRMLPGLDGLALIQRLREEGVGTPALIISALGEIDDRGSLYPYLRIYGPNGALLDSNFGPHATEVTAQATKLLSTISNLSLGERP